MNDEFQYWNAEGVSVVAKDIIKKRDKYKTRYQRRYNPDFFDCNFTTSTGEVYDFCSDINEDTTILPPFVSRVL